MRIINWSSDVCSSDLPGISEAVCFGIDHLAPGGTGIGHRHFHRTLLLATLLAITAHLLQSAHAALVAGSTRLDTLANPHLFLRQQFVEARIALRFGVQAFLAPKIGRAHV